MLPESAGSIPRKSTKYLPSTRLQGGTGEIGAEGVHEAREGHPLFQLSAERSTWVVWLLEA